MHLTLQAWSENESALVQKYYCTHASAHRDDAGLDLFFLHSFSIEPGQTAKIGLGVKAKATMNGKNVSYFIIPRSSIANTPLRMANSIGLIDAGYRGELIVALDNISSNTYYVEEGTKLFQVVGSPCDTITLELGSVTDETSRGTGGFGSSG